MTLFDVAEIEPDLGNRTDSKTRTDDPLCSRTDTRTPTETEAVETGQLVAEAQIVEDTKAAPVVEVRVSSRRRKTSEARWVDGRIIVTLPAHLDGASRQQTIDWLVKRLLSRFPPKPELTDEALFARAVELSVRYLVGVRPASVRWVTNQTARWGSCSYHSGDIRISHRLRPVPAWVLDSVLVHELAHLTYPDHSPAFHRLANSYPRHDEAGSFLAGYELGLSHPPA
jgi:hypothetical protein